MNSQIDSEDMILHNMGDAMIYRFQISLNDISSEMDNSSPQNINDLKSKATNLIRSSKNEIDRLVKALSAF